MCTCGKLNCPDCNPTYTYTESITPSSLAIHPGSVIYTDDITPEQRLREYVKWKSYPKSVEEMNNDRLRHLKIFTHFAIRLATQFPNWEVTPSADDPFNKVYLKHKVTNVQMGMGYPDNDIRIYGLPPQVNELGLKYRSVNCPTFYGWTLGMGDIPSWVTE